ncbi:MAG: type II toxin-antitoxin system RelE/ParE family toxin [Gallionella sp.]
MRYAGQMIIRFASKESEKIWRGKMSRKLPHDIQQVALRKLFMLDKAYSLNDLRIPPANRLEVLKNDRKGQHSIRVNDQWRICFRWTDNGPDAVEIVDYH